MAQLDAAGDPARAFRDGQYRASSHAVGDRIAARLEIDPQSTHILIGGVGSGKTTELFRIQQRLSETSSADILSIFLDASELRLTHFAEDVVRELCEFFDVVASDAIWVGDTADELVLKARPKDIVLLLDGLDRLGSLSRFEALVRKDLEVLSQRFGVVVVGPLRCLYGIERVLAQRFDEQHYQPWVDPAHGQGFLRDVVLSRIPDGISHDAVDALVRASGGVLRDLISLAQGACVEAYAGETNRIELEHARISIDAFGRKHIQGLRPSELHLLQRVRKSGVFVHTSEDDLALLMSRRVLEYRVDGQPRYAVHPTIEPLLRSLDPGDVPF